MVRASAVTAVLKRFKDSNLESGVNAFTVVSVIFVSVNRKERRFFMEAMVPEERSVMEVREKSAATICPLMGARKASSSSPNLDPSSDAFTTRFAEPRDS